MENKNPSGMFWVWPRVSYQLDVYGVPPHVGIQAAYLGEAPEIPQCISGFTKGPFLYHYIILLNLL